MYMYISGAFLVLFRLLCSSFLLGKAGVFFVCLGFFFCLVGFLGGFFLGGEGGERS